MVFLRTHQPYSGTEVLMETKLERIAEKSANSPRPEFTSLYHLINKEMLLQCHKELDGNKAVGVDEITKKEYERNLEQNIDDLVERLKRKSYKPQPSIRVYIPKSNGKLRPLGIACYEDKMVQLALKKILEAIKKVTWSLTWPKPNVAMPTTFSTRAPTNLPGLLCTQSCWSTSQI